MSFISNSQLTANPLPVIMYLTWQMIPHLKRLNEEVGGPWLDCIHLSLWLFIVINRYWESYGLKSLPNLVSWASMGHQWWETNRAKAMRVKVAAVIKELCADNWHWSANNEVGLRLSMSGDLILNMGSVKKIGLYLMSSFKILNQLLCFFQTKQTKNPT